MINFPSPLTITRFAPGDYDDDGVWQDEATSSVVVSANVQPITDRTGTRALEKILDRQGLTYSDGMVRVYSNQQLYPASSETGRKGDRFTFAGRLYEVVGVDTYGTLIPHYRAFGRLVDQNTLEAAE